MAGLEPLSGNNAEQYLLWLYSQNPVCRFSPVILPMQMQINNHYSGFFISEPVLNNLQNPATQKLKLILQCAQSSPEFTFNEGSYLSILSDSGVLTKEISEMIDKILINKTDTITEIISGISSLDTASLTESEIEIEAEKYNNLLNKARSHMAEYRNILLQTVEKVKNSMNSGDTCDAESIRNELINNLNQKFTF